MVCTTLLFGKRRPSLSLGVETNPRSSARINFLMNLKDCLLDVPVHEGVPAPVPDDQKPGLSNVGSSGSQRPGGPRGAGFRAYLEARKEFVFFREELKLRVKRKIRKSTTTMDNIERRAQTVRRWRLSMLLLLAHICPESLLSVRLPAAGHHLQLRVGMGFVYRLNQAQMLQRHGV